MNIFVKLLSFSSFCDSQLVGCSTFEMFSSTLFWFIITSIPLVYSSLNRIFVFLPTIPLFRQYKADGLMDPINDARFYESLIKLPRQRTPEVSNWIYLLIVSIFKDIKNIYDQLRHLEMFQHLNNGPLKAISASARYERHQAHHILFRLAIVLICYFFVLSLLGTQGVSLVLILFPSIKKVLTVWP